jgi:DNA-binding transcriptional LysR family regulator
MDLFKAMRTFATVVDEGSFAAASRSLDLAPAIVTRLVAQLEDHVGARLINRTTRRLALTELGENYLERVRSILANIDEAGAAIEAATREPSGMLRVGAPGTLLTHQLARYLPEFRRRYPKVTLNLNALQRQAAEGPDESVDVTLILAPGELLDGDFLARRLATAEVVFCATPAYLDEHGRPSHPSELEQHEMLVPIVQNVPRTLRFERFDAAHGVIESVLAKPYRMRAINTLHHETLYAAAVAGMGIVATLSFIAEEGVANGTMEHVLAPWSSLTYTLYAAMPSRKFVPPRTRVFIDFLVEKFGGQANDPWLARMLTAGGREPLRAVEHREARTKEAAL